MRKYVIENTLGTTTQQRTVAAIISLILSLMITAAMYLLHIRVPNPPFETKTGELMLDFGLEEVSYGSPNEGGPSDFLQNEEVDLQKTLLQLPLVRFKLVDMGILLILPIRALKPDFRQLILLQVKLLKLIQD